MARTDRALFELLHEQYQPMVLQVCLGFVKGDSDLAKDLTQDVFINIWNALDTFKGASSYKTWIYRITVNSCLKHIRDVKDTNRVPLEKLNSYPADEGHVKRDANKNLYAAIGRLAEVDRMIIMMVLDELEYDDIADVIGINPGNLRVKIHRIKKQLKEILEYEQ